MDKSSRKQAGRRAKGDALSPNRHVTRTKSVVRECGTKSHGEAPILRRIREMELGIESKFIYAAFDDPEDGWIGLCVQANAQNFFENLEYAPYDSFQELATALALLLHDNSEADVHWNQGPSYFRFNFQRSADDITFTIYHLPGHNAVKSEIQAIFTTNGPYADICRPFWKAVCDLRSRFTNAELSRRWHSEFPGPKFDRLGDLIRDHARRVK